jgi:hypothetical protein
MGSAQHLTVVIVVAIAVVAVLRFELFCISDLRSTPESQLRYLTRAGWIAACLLSIPIGGIVYLSCGKRR